MPARSDAGRSRVLLVGPGSPVGAAFRAATSAAAAGLADFGFAAEGDEIGAVIEFAGEPRLVGALDEREVLDADLVILAAADDGARQALSVAGRGRGSVLDLAGIDPEPAAVINMEVNADRLEREQPRRVRAPHTAARLITTAAATLAGAGRIVRLGATVLLPAGDGVRDGAEELVLQTAAVLSFKPPPQAALGHLAAFNVVPWCLRPAPEGADRDARLRLECAGVLGLPRTAVTVHALAVPVLQSTSILLTVALESAAAVAGWQSRFRARAWKVGATTPAEIGESTVPHVHALGTEADGSISLWMVADLPPADAAANAARIASALLPAPEATD